MDTENRTTGTEIIAHRGASYYAPENTIAAINLAWKVDADAVEIDIYLTADHRIVAIHDANTRRTGGVDISVPDSKFAQLRKVDVGRFRGDQYADERIPTLEECLVTIPPGKRMLIEIKSGPEALPVLIPKFMAILKGSGKTDSQTPVISFSKEAIKAVKQARPSLKAYWLCSPGRIPVEDLIATAKSIGADGLDVQGLDSLDEDFVRKVREAGMELYVWTVDSEDKAIRFANMGLDGITTNKPREIMDAVKGIG